MARKARARSKVTPLHYVTFYGTIIHDTELDVADLCCVDTIHTNGQVQFSNPRISGGRSYPSIPTLSQPKTEALATSPTWHPGPFEEYIFFPLLLALLVLTFSHSGTHILATRLEMLFAADSAYTLQGRLAPIPVA